MCGIVGWVKSNTSCIAAGLVKDMAECIAYRGPDESGFFFDHGIALGHRRLSIIDLKQGRQPMITEDGRYVIIYNGEVYNFKTLRSELEETGELFTTHTDTEVILRAFWHWGPDIFIRLQGMFALAIWDNLKKTLHLARDHLGIKPLYYADLNGELVFASEIKALFCHPCVKRYMDPQIVASFLAFNNTFGDRSFWTGIKRCQPGERIEWHNGELHSFRYFNIGNLRVEPFKGSFEDAADKYKELLKDSVNDHLISDVRVGSYLSGGIDSSSVALLAATKKDDSLPVFTGYFKGFENSWYDERSAARVIIKKNDMIHYECPISWDDFSQNFEKVAYHLDEPTLGSGAIPQFMVAKQVSKVVKVVLTGHGGDELFAGYPIFKAALIRENSIFKKGIRCLYSGGLDEKLRIIYFLIGGITDPVIARGQFRMFLYNGIKRVAADLLMDSVNKAGGINGLLMLLQPFNSNKDIDGITRWYIGTYLPTLLVQEDKISMANGLEARVPICYESLVRLSLSLPGEIKLDSCELKAVPRKGMRSILPLSTFTFPKRGFPTPIIGWLKGSLGYDWEKKWEEPLPLPLDGLINEKGVHREFHRFRMCSHLMPNAYALAHRIISLQMLLSCASSLQSVKPTKNFYLDRDERQRLPGPVLLDRQLKQLI